MIQRCRVQPERFQHISNPESGQQRTYLHPAAQVKLLHEGVFDAEATSYPIVLIGADIKRHQRMFQNLVLKTSLDGKRPEAI